MKSKQKCLEVSALFVLILFFGVSSAFASEASHKGFVLKSRDNYHKLRIAGQIQGRLSARPDKVIGEMFTAELPKVRIKLSGNVASPLLKFKLQIGFDKMKVKLKDAYLDLALIPDWLYLRGGRFKASYSRLSMTSGQSLEFTDRASPYKKFKVGRANGISLHSAKKASFEWAAAVYEKGKSKVSEQPLGGIFARVGYNYNRLNLSTEPDLEGGSLRFATMVGSHARYNLESWKQAGYGSSIGFAAKWQGLSINLSTYLGLREYTKVQTDPLKKLDVGGYGQLGYVLKKQFGFSARYAVVSKLEFTKPKQEFMGGLSYYMLGHNAKIQLNGGGLLKYGVFKPRVYLQFQLAY